MPLLKSASKEAVGKNIRAELRAGKPKAQAVAIALDVQRRAGGGTQRSTPKRKQDGRKGK